MTLVSLLDSGDVYFKRQTTWGMPKVFGTSITSQRSCPICEAREAERVEAYSPDEWDLVSCNRCGFVFISNPPDYSRLEEEFAWEKTYREKKLVGGSTPLSGINRWLRSHRHRIGVRRSAWHANLWRGPCKVLDVGCGGSIRTQPPIVPFGIEISNALHALADSRMRGRGGYCVHASGADGVWTFDPGFFDGAILSSYLEHESDPNRVLLGLHRCLKPGSKVFVRVPNYGSVNRRLVGRKWCGFRHPDHVNYFTVKSLRNMAERSGFRLSVLNWLRLPLDDNINAMFIRDNLEAGSC